MKVRPQRFMHTHFLKRHIDEMMEMDDSVRTGTILVHTTSRLVG